MFNDPDWFFWAYGKAVFQDRGSLACESIEICEKSRSILIPQSGEGKTVVEYFIHPITKEFSHFQLVPESRPQHQGASPTLRLDVVDMALVREISSYDKGGYRRLINDIKTLIFSDPSMKMTKTRCEAFFSDGGNFNL